MIVIAVDTMIMIIDMASDFSDDKLFSHFNGVFLLPPVPVAGLSDNGSWAYALSQSRSDLSRSQASRIHLASSAYAGFVISFTGTS